MSTCFIVYSDTYFKNKTPKIHIVGIGIHRVSNVDMTVSDSKKHEYPKN